MFTFSEKKVTSKPAIDILNKKRSQDNTSKLNKATQDLNDAVEEIEEEN